MKKGNKLVFLLIPVLLVLSLYVSGYVAQFLRNYDEWKVEYGLASGVSPELPSSDFITCINIVFSTDYGIKALILVVIIMAIICFWIIFVGKGQNGTTDRKRNIVYSDSGNYGTAGFMSEDEFDNVLESCSPKNVTGIILGKLDNKAVCLPNNTRMNRNIAVYGASGSMKSRAFVRNRIFQAVKRNESIFVTDPKSELYEDMATYLRNNGYKVKVFNLINMENSDSWNCLKEIEGSELMAQVFADVIIKNTSSGQSDHFWDNAELNLLKALILYVDRNYKTKSIGAVYELLSTKSESQLNGLFAGLTPEHPAYAPYNIFKQSSDTVRAGVIIGLGARLQVFQNEIVKSITAYDDIDLELSSVKYTSKNDVLRDDGSIGTLKISKIGLSVKVFDGTTSSSMKKGVGHFAETSYWNGNVALSGHNRGINDNFGKLKKLSKGDIITYKTELGTRKYEVFYVGQIGVTDLSRLNPSSENMITLITCVENQPLLRLCVQAKELK